LDDAVLDVVEKGCNEDAMYDGFTLCIVIGRRRLFR
jgi:hypothetical protein